MNTPNNQQDLLAFSSLKNIFVAFSREGEGASLQHATSLEKNRRVL